jgi:hypothetical protein
LTRTRRAKWRDKTRFRVGGWVPAGPPIFLLHPHLKDVRKMGSTTGKDEGFGFFFQSTLIIPKLKGCNSNFKDTFSPRFHPYYET